MDYTKEVKELEEYQSKNWFKPQPGTYQVLILSEPREAAYTDSEGNVTPQIEIDIEVNKEHYGWTIGKGKTLASLYGQLMKIGAEKGQLDGQQITLIVKSDGKKNDYTIVEANIQKEPTTKEQATKQYEEEVVDQETQEQEKSQS